MAGSFGNYLENELLDHVFGAAAYSAPATLYIALSTADPTDDASGIAEPVANGYERKAVTNNTTNWNTASGGATSNKTAIEFAVASGSWGAITHFAIYDAATEGNMLAHADLTTGKTIASGDTARFAAGELDITLG